MKETEDRIQASMVKWFKETFPEAVIFHVPNGKKLSRISGAIFKAIGVLAGIPDLIIVTYGKIFFVEVKTPQNISKKYKGTSPSQRKVHEKLKTLGFQVYICATLDYFQQIILTEIHDA